MLEVKIPNNFIAERQYIIETLLSDFLGIETEISVGDDEDYKLILPNKSEIIIKDDFFSKFNEDEGYLSVKNIPNKIDYAQNSFTPEADIPVLYGNERIVVDEKKIECSIDIFASSFFMLTRWEEAVIKEKDEHQRFPDELSLAQKFNFHKRPIVNEYTEMLWNFILQLNSKQKRKQRKYQVILTHDVDYFRRYNSINKYINAIGGDIILRKNPLLWFKTTFDFITTKLKLKKDQYDTFDYLMDVSDKHHLKSRFYFIPGKPREEDVRYDIDDPLIKKTIDNIFKRGHITGLHGTYKSFNKPDDFQSELKRLKSIYPHITEGRQHYLRFQNPKTWQIWDEANMLSDSSIGFANTPGFRSGVCYAYPVFNIETRKKLKLQEQALIFMEGALGWKNHKASHFVDELSQLSNIVKKYNGNFVFLWHQNNIKNYEWKTIAKNYETYINIIAEND